MKKNLFILFFFIASSSFSQTPKVTPPIGHTEAVFDAEFSPDGKKIVTASADGTAKLWDTETGLFLADLIGHTDQVYSAKFSPDGKSIVTAGKDYTARVWDATTSLPIRTLQTVAESAEFSSDGKMILSYSAQESQDRMWDTNSGKLIANLLPGIVDQGFLHVGFHTYAATFSPDGTRFVVGTSDSCAQIWDTRTGALLKTLVHKGDVLTAFFSPDGKRVITFPADQNAKIWDVATGSHIADIKSTDFECVLFSPDGNRVITVSKDENFSKSFVFATIWNAGTGFPIATLRGHSDGIRSVQFSADGRKIVTASSDNTAKIWDARTGALLKDLKGHLDAVNAANFSPDGKKIVTASSDNTAKIWDADTGMLLNDLKGETSAVWSASFSRDGKSIISSSLDYLMKAWDTKTANLSKEWTGPVRKDYPQYFSSDNKLIVTLFSELGKDNSSGAVWNAETGKILAKLKNLPNYAEVIFFPNHEKIAVTAGTTTTIWDTGTGMLLETLDGSACAISPDGLKIVTASKDSTAKVWDSNTGQILKALKGNRIQITTAVFSMDGQRIVTTSADSTARIWDAHTGMLIKILNGSHVWKSTLFEYTEKIKSAIFSPDGKKIIFTTFENWVGIWDMETGNLLGYLPETKGLITTSNLIKSIIFSPEGEKMAVFSADETMKIWDLATYTFQYEINGVSDGAFSPDGTKIITYSYDHTIKIWNAGNGKVIYTTIVVGSNGSLNLLPSGYYDAAPGAAKLLHYVTDSLKTFTFEQLDIKYNRPDKVLTAIGSDDGVLINIYHKVYQKRMGYLQIDTTTFSDDYNIPVANIVNRDSLKQFGKQLKLHIMAADNVHPLNRFNVWVNQVPIYGVNGISLTSLNKKQLNTNVVITLSAGTNRIETSVINSNGAESYHKPVVYNNNIKGPSHVYFLGIGTDHFASGQHTLQWSVNDIRSLALRVKAKFGINCTVDTLFDGSVTIDRVKELKRLIQHTTVNDKVIVAYSGHGLLSNSYDYYLSSFNVNFDQPQKGGIPYELLENLMDSIPARQKLMLIDACHSGEIDKTMAISDTSSTDGLDIDALNTAAQHQSDELEKNGGVANQRFFALMQQMFANVGKNTGATVISSSAATQYAREGKRNAVFAASILEYLEREHVSISGLEQYLLKRVPALTNGQQVPTTRAETNNTDWNLW